VTHLLGTESIERTLEDLILEKTEGIPFYVEEFVKSRPEQALNQERMLGRYELEYKLTSFERESCIYRGHI
jgi:predicted ATPase